MGMMARRRLSTSTMSEQSCEGVVGRICSRVVAWKGRRSLIEKPLRRETKQRWRRRSRRKGVDAAGVKAASRLGRGGLMQLASKAALKLRHELRQSCGKAERQ